LAGRGEGGRERDGEKEMKDLLRREQRVPKERRGDLGGAACTYTNRPRRKANILL